MEPIIYNELRAPAFAGMTDQMPFYETIIFFKNMKKIILLTSITIFGWVGWWLGAHIGFMTAYAVSFIGSLIGVYAGVRINQAYLD